jgi:hypothetical protein
MRSARILGSKVLVALVLCGFAAEAGRTQQTTTPIQTPGSTPALSKDPHDPFGLGDKGDLPVDMRERQMNARELERQKQLVADTDRLLTLATQLHNDVAKTNKDILSIDVVKRADEIEKLAHAVKERMKG